MVGNGHSKWLGPGSPWTSTKVGEVAGGIIRSQATDKQVGANSRALATGHSTKQRARSRSRRSSGTCSFESVEFGGCFDRYGSRRCPPSALSKAKQVAQERPLKVQLAQTGAFVERSRQRIKKLEEERDAEVEFLNAALQRQARLREQVAAEPATTVVNPVNPSEEIARLKAKVAQLEAAAKHPPRCSVEAAEAGKMRAAKRRAGCVDDSLPNDEQALCEWVDSKMMELRDATDVGDLDSDRLRCIQDEIGEP